MKRLAPRTLKFLQFSFITVAAALIEKVPNVADVHMISIDVAPWFLNHLLTALMVWFQQRTLLTFGKYFPIAIQSVWDNTELQITCKQSNQHEIVIDYNYLLKLFFF